MAPTPWDSSQVWWHAQERLRPHQPPAPSPASGLLDSVMTPDSGMEGGESAAASFVEKFQKYPKKPWSSLYPSVSSQAIDLLDRMLAFNPSTRITVEEALQHPYLASFYDPRDEPVAEHPFEFEEELDNVPIPVLKERMLKEVNEFRQAAGL
ncbi:unnamed protein product [Schistocephalus solidus]|uniref:Mitogen-activated protein kinase 13 n=1 Tax=Schistocephalus solidus TaxID=70667 RepID=A0A183SZC7_SCHSO|nr:unnamed protein product [Schistocephalus solidus]